MTRETKVGLLVGMGVILLIGIIISDHLSQVNGQLPAIGQMTEFAERAQDSINPLVKPEPLPHPAPLARQEGSVLSRVQQVPTPSEMERPRSDQAVQPSPPGLAAAPELPRAYQVEGARPSAGDVSPMGQPTAAMAEGVPTWRLTHEAQAGHLGGSESASSGFDATLAAVNAAEQANVALAATARETVVAAPSGTEFIHYVKDGETLYSIAQRFYNNGDYWKTIAQHNPGKVMPNGQVRPNVRLVIPNRAGLVDLGPDFVPVEGAPGRIQLARGEPPQGAAAVRAQRTIEVREGDTLTKLASEHMGSAGAWRKLLEANRERLSRPEDLQVGMKLVLPADPAPTTSSPAAPGKPVAGSASASKQREAVVAPAKPPTAGEYTIQEGDTLYRIAARNLGDGKRWREIYEANKDRLDNPDAVKAGIKLRIPAR